MKVKKFGAISVVVLLLLFSSYTLLDQGESESERVLLGAVLRGLRAHHYQPQDIDDTFSQNVFDLYLKRLDYGKRYFLKKDIDQLASYQDKVDDLLIQGSYEFFDSSTVIYLERKDVVKQFYKDILEKPFDFTVAEEINLDPEKNDYANTQEELKEVWRKLLKYQTMTRYEDMLQKKEKGKDYEDKSEAELEAEARKKVKKIFDDRFHLQDKYTLTDYRDDFINVLANIFDPHTGYYPPKDKENFDIGMSGKLEGIGATLVDKEGYITVNSIVPGSPSAKQGDLEVGDIILKVGQGDEEAVDIVDMRLDDAVRLIRGKKGTTVKLTIRKAAGLENEIAIVRDVVNLEERYAKSAVLIDEEESKKVGYIELPTFYADFKDRSSRSCAKDVEREIEKLKGEGVDGIVLDLRFNGGGSLRDVVDMAGLFIEKGPVVQVKSRTGDPYVLVDKDPRVQYDGPLVIMVNTFSASASEILAAAIQDYHRGIVLGSPSTYGKGTVQLFIDLNDYVQGGSFSKPLGSMKLTTQKFYRINGDATQRKGVISDIILPDEFSYRDLGEKDQDFAMKWDTINAVDYKIWDTDVNKSTIIANSMSRIENNEVFKLKQANADRLKKQQDNQTLPLNLSDYQAYQESLKKEAEKFKDIDKPISSFNATTLNEDLAHINSDSTLMKNRTTWLNEIKKDMYIYEAMHVIQDIDNEAIVKKE